MKTTGERIKDIRLELGETLEKFGKRFNPPANRSLVSGWENNRYTPSPERLKVIAELGGMHVKELVSTNSVGERIKRIREELGISMSEFALLIDDKAKSGTVANWETGKNLPNRKRLNRIAELGNTTVNQLLNSNPLSDYSTDELLQELERRGGVMKQLTSRQLDNYAKTSIDEYLNSGDLKHLKDASCIYRMFKLKIKFLEMKARNYS